MRKRLAISMLALMTLGSIAQAQDWSGFYAGLNKVRLSGTYSHYDSGVISPGNTEDIDGDQVGGFLGYSMQSGNLVYGAEIAFGSGDVLVGGSTIYYFNNMLDIRGRVGYAVGKVLVYGTLGMTKADQHWEDGAVTNSPVRVDGLSWGLGADLAVTDRVFVGLAYQRVTLVAEEGEIGGFPLVETNDDLETVSLRIGMKF